MSEGSVVSQDKRQDKSEVHNLPPVAQHKIVIIMTHEIGPAQCTSVRPETLLPFKQLTKVELSVALAKRHCISFSSAPKNVSVK